MNINEPKFDLIVFGGTAKDAELEQLIEKLAVLLKINQDQAKHLLETSTGKTIVKATTLEIVGPIRDAILAIGIKADIVPTKLNDKLELVQIETHKVSCPACEHVHILEDKVQLEVCANCGIVVSKYEKIQKEKEEKERLRNLLLAEHQSKIEAARIQREAEEAAFKCRQLKEAALKKLGIPKIINSKNRLISSAIAVHVIGVILGIGVMYFFGTITRQPIKSSVNENQEMTNKNLNLGIIGQMLVSKMLANFDPLKIIESDSTEANITSQSQSTIEFLDTKLSALKTDAEWDQHLLIQIDTLLAQGNFDSATSLLNKLNRADLRFNRGGQLIGQLWNRNQAAAANKLYRELTAASERAIGGPLARIEALCVIGHHLNTAGRKNEANAVLRKARTFESSIVESMERAEANSNIAALMAVLGQEEDARFLFSSAISILEEIQDPVQQLLGIASIAPSYAKAGYRSSALNLLETAIRKASSITNVTARAQALEPLAKVSSELSDVQMALTAVQPISIPALQDQVLYNIIIEEVLADRLAQAMDLSEKIKTPTYRALTFGFLGLNQQRQANYQGLAAGSLAQSHQAMDAISIPSEKAAIASELGRFLARSGNEEKANAYFAKSKKLMQTLNKTPERDRALAILAINKAQVSRFNEAQADVNEIHDMDLRRIVTTDVKSWQ